VTGAATLVLPLASADLDGSLQTLAMLPHDPTVRLRPGHLERATVTPEGTATLLADWVVGDAATVRAVGDGADWLLARAAGALGLLDDPSGFAPRAQPLRDLWRRHSGDRIPRTGTLWHDLAWFVVQQRVRREDADAQWRRLVTAFGTPAPGAEGLLAPPDAATVARLPYASLHAVGLERRRAQTLVDAARAVTRLQHLVDEPFVDAEPHLRRLGGVGPWTRAAWRLHVGRGRPRRRGRRRHPVAGGVGARAELAPTTPACSSCSSRTGPHRAASCGWPSAAACAPAIRTPPAAHDIRRR
jgi:hypothetical protein